MWAASMPSTPVPRSTSRDWIRPRGSPLSDAKLVRLQHGLDALPEFFVQWRKDLSQPERHVHRDEHAGGGEEMILRAVPISDPEAQAAESQVTTREEGTHLEGLRELDRCSKVVHGI